MAEVPAPEQEIQEVERETRGLTSYVVLEKVRDDAAELAWIVAGTIDATHAEHAVKKLAGDNGVYVAVPARSWKPMRVQQVQTVQTVVEAVES